MKWGKPLVGRGGTVNSLCWGLLSGERDTQQREPGFYSLHFLSSEVSFTVFCQSRLRRQDPSDSLRHNHRGTDEEQTWTRIQSRLTTIRDQG